MMIPEEVQIRYTTPDGATQTDITGNVIYADAYFEMQAAAVPGSFHITVKDPDQTLWFVSGGVIDLTVGGTRMFGGYISVRTMDFFFSADRTDVPVMTRRWSLDGVDFNGILDKRVLRYLTKMTEAPPDVAVANASDAHILSLFDQYFDLGFTGGNTIDATSMVTHVNNFTVKWKWPTPGSTMRQVLDALVIETTIHGQVACIYWLDAYAQINWLALQDTMAPWGFSDIPSTGGPITFIGWRDGSASEDGSSVINDVFIWGGSPLGSNGTVRVAHKDNTDSIDAHGLWQMAEAHPGEEGYKSQGEVDARANALISGDTSGTGSMGTQGLVNPDTQYSLTWFAHDVPLDGGVRQHLIPGNVTTLNLWSFSNDGGITPFAIDVPLRQVRVTFPTLPSDNPSEEMLSFVQFQGTFGLQLADPVWWWAFLRRMRPAPQAAPIITTTGTSSSFPYGSYFTGYPKESPNGTRTVFSIAPTYMPGTLEVYIGGIPQTSAAFSETNPAEPTGGTFTFITAPVSTDVIVCTCRTG